MMHRDYVPFYDERFRGYYWCVRGACSCGGWFTPGQAMMHKAAHAGRLLHGVPGVPCPRLPAATLGAMREGSCTAPTLDPHTTPPRPARRNKVQHLMHISLQNGFNFLVHPTAFVVHVPHKKPSTKWLTRKMGQVGGWGLLVAPTAEAMQISRSAGACRVWGSRPHRVLNGGL